MSQNFEHPSQFRNPIRNGLMGQQKLRHATAYEDLVSLVGRRIIMRTFFLVGEDSLRVRTSDFQGK